jgi:hypothetical protein
LPDHQLLVVPENRVDQVEDGMEETVPALGIVPVAAM